MTADGSGRPQDQGRKHRAKPAPSAETSALLDRYQGAMRAELEDLLGSLEPVPQDPGLGMVPVAPKRPPLAERTRTWDLAIKLARELGASIDVAPPAADVGGTSRQRGGGPIKPGRTEW